MTTESAATAGFDLEAFRARFHDAWNSHDPEAIVALLTEDVVWIDPTRPEPVVGAAAVLDFLRASFRTFPDLHFTASDPPHLTATGDQVACGWTMEGTMRGSFEPQGFAPTGRRMRVDGDDLWVMRDGRIALYRTYYDVTHVARQLGIMPPAGSLAERAFVAVQRVQARVLNR